jgi:hypothetical protein
LEQSITEFVGYYNNQRYHEAIDNLTPADVYSGKSEEVLTKQEQIKKHTLASRCRLNLQVAVSYQLHLHKTIVQKLTGKV